MMKSIAILTVLMAGFCFTFGTCIAQTANGPQKKGQQVKVVVSKDGKSLAKDTMIVTSVGKGVIFSGKDVVFNGDSIIISKDGKNKEQTVTVFVNGEKGNSSKSGKTSTYTYSFTSGDSVQKNVTQKMIRTDNGKQMMLLQNGEENTIDLPASPPFVKGHRIIGHPLGNPFDFDPTDTTIVSYKKKDMGKGLEKITIVRKKAVITK